MVGVANWLLNFDVKLVFLFFDKIEDIISYLPRLDERELSKLNLSNSDSSERKNTVLVTWRTDCHIVSPITASLSAWLFVSLRTAQCKFPTEKRILLSINHWENSHKLCFSNDIKHHWPKIVAQKIKASKLNESVCWSASALGWPAEQPRKKGLQKWGRK